MLENTWKHAVGCFSSFFQRFRDFRTSEAPFAPEVVPVVPGSILLAKSPWQLRVQIMPDPSHQWRTAKISEVGKLCKAVHAVPSCRSSHDVFNLFKHVQTTIATDHFLKLLSVACLKRFQNAFKLSRLLEIPGMLKCSWNMLKPILSGSYLAHTQGKKHQINLCRRAAREKQARPVQNINLRQDPVNDFWHTISWSFEVLSYFVIMSWSFFALLGFELCASVFVDQDATIQPQPQTSSGGLPGVKRHAWRPHNEWLCWIILILWSYVS